MNLSASTIRTRKWAEEHPGYFAKKTAEWRAANPERRKKQDRNYREKNRLKRRARDAAKNAVVSGKLIQHPCEICQNPESEKHHEDYSKPLSVSWLCDTCHTKKHLKLPAVT